MSGFVDAKQSLIESSERESYKGEKLTIAETATTAEVKAIAEQAKLDSSELLGSTSLLVLICIVGFIAAHAVGQGAVIWVYISEIFPNDQRAAGQAFGCFTHWILAASLTFAFPIAIKAFDAGYMFAFFALMMVLQLIWVKFRVVETKGISLEEVEVELGVNTKS